MVGLLVAFSALAVASTIAYRAWINAGRVFHPERRRPVTWPADRPAVDGRTDVEARSAAGLAVRGWFLPSRNGAAVVFVHGRDADRRQLIEEALWMHGRGFGAVLYDEPGCGDSDGTVTWGRAERDALRAVLAWLVDRAGIAAPIGLFGFSKGAYAATQVAASHEGIGALVLAGPVANFPDQTRYEFRRYGALSQWPALRARERGGFVPSDPQPDQLIGSYGRPLLLITGERDDAVPGSHAERLFRTAREPKAWWVVPGGGHGDFARSSPDYLTRVAAFYEDALLPP
jgi:alpha-beta hydrolase superfamily lysophospholipase